MNIYVGNITYSTDGAKLTEIFSAFGEVSSARVINDRETGRSKGFGFVEMPNAAEANAAIEALNQKEIDGRTLRVNEAKPKEDRPERPRSDRSDRSDRPRRPRY